MGTRTKCGMATGRACGCQCASLRSPWPPCTKSSCGGRSSGAAAFMAAAAAASSSGSRSSARSHTAALPSAEVVTSMELSAGHHSTEVTAPLQPSKT